MNVKKTCCLSILALYFLIAKNAGGFSTFIEAEDFDNLAYYGSWTDAKGWYIKRHSHASGGAFGVTHYKNAVLEKKMQENIPPGNYRVFLRLVMNRSAETENILRINIGGRDKNGSFKPEASAEFIQDFSGSGYGWFRIGDVFTLNKPCDVLQIEALSVENMGIGDDPEYEKPYAIVDSVIITSGEPELLESNRGRNKLKFADGEDPRATSERIAYPVISTTVNYSSLPEPREVFLSEKNLLRNSSFEFNIKPFFIGGNADPTSTGNNVDNINLCRENPYHGNYCLEIGAELQNLLAAGYSGSETKPVYGNALSAFYLDSFIKAELSNLSSQQPLVVSYYLRTNDRKIKFDGTEISHTEWKRYNKKWKAGQDIFRFTSEASDAVVYIDAVQIERGEAPTEYQPLDGLEAGALLPDSYAGIRHQSEKTPLEFSVSQGPGKPETVTINYRILDTHLDMEYSGELTITSQPEQVVAKQIEIPFSKLGIFLLVYEVSGRPELSYAIPFSVVENPGNFADSKPQLGSIISSNEEIMRIFKHAGFDWVNTLNDRIAYFNYIWPKDGEMHFFHDWYRMWQEKYGIEYSFWRPPFNPPSWTKNIIGREPAAHMGKPNISYEDWERFWELFTKNVNYIKIWQPTDEQSYHRGPHESLKYIDIATRIIRKNVPDAFIMNSTQARHVKEMLKIDPSLDLGDAAGGSRHNFERNTLFYDRSIKQLTDREYWVVGVGWTGNGWDRALNFETFIPNNSFFEGRFLQEPDRVQKSVFNNASIVGVERFGLYSAKFDRGRDPFSLFNGDNTIKPFGVSFINSINFLRDHKPGNTIPMDSAYGIYAGYLYRGNGKLLVMLSPDGSYEKIEVNLDLPETGVTLYDYNFNVIPFESMITLPVSKSLYIEENGMGEDALLAAVKSINAHPVNMERRIITHSASGNKLLLATLQNIEGKTRRIAEVELPEKTGFHEPIDQSRDMRNASWATVAQKVQADAITIDGNIDEPHWKKAAPSFIYCWDAIDGSYSAIQGVENFDHIFSLKTISVTFRSLWDGANILLAFDVFDDRIAKGDSIILKFDADIMESYVSPDPKENLFIAVLKPFEQPSEFRSDILNFEGKKTGECTAGLSVNEAGYTMELKIPLSSLGVADLTADTLGFTVEVVDDYGGDEKTVLSWTTNYAPRKSPAGFGQMVLLK